MTSRKKPITNHGYYRYPSIAGQVICFLSENNLWLVRASGGEPRKLTTGLESVSSPVLSPDGKWMAFSAAVDGAIEVFVIAATGGPARRLTHFGSTSYAAGWTNTQEVIALSDAESAISGMPMAYTVSLQTAIPILLKIGPVGFAFDTGDGWMVQRPAVDPEAWRGYRGGVAGLLWLSFGDNDYRELTYPGNPSRPMRIGERLFVTLDHEGSPNLYSSDLQGGNLKRATHHKHYSVRHAATDGRTIVYECGADLYTLNLVSGRSRKVAIQFRSARPLRRRIELDPVRYFETCSLSRSGRRLAIISRGRAFLTKANGTHATELSRGRYGRFSQPTWLADDRRLVLVNDNSGEETLEVYDSKTGKRTAALVNLPLGRITSLAASPTRAEVALTNHRQELLLVDLASKSVTQLGASHPNPIQGFDYSPDGKWLAYAASSSAHTTVIKLVRLKDGAAFDVTHPQFGAFSPSFDPSGDHLYFLSHRIFDPVLDNHFPSVGFPAGVQPCCVSLKSNDDMDPLLLADRVRPVPIPDAKHIAVQGVKHGMLLLTQPIHGALVHRSFPQLDPPNALLSFVDTRTGHTTNLATQVSGCAMSLNRSAIAFRTGSRLMVLNHDQWNNTTAAAEAPLHKLPLKIDPPLEWRQMFAESWRMQRDYCWNPDDKSLARWQQCLKRYGALLDRLGSREELTDLLRQMLGELSLSHVEVHEPERERPAHANHLPALRYHAWEQRNRDTVHAALGKLAGYIHIPDFASHGCAEFFRQYASEIDRPNLILDLRFNAGGYLHDAILEKLLRPRIGLLATRWSGRRAFPEYSIEGRMVILVNEYTRSAGEVVAQSLRSVGYGPVIGKRTWGGVTAHWPVHALVDGGFTTQPQAASWFPTVEFKLENRGVEPEISLDITPQDYANNRDPQLARAIEELTTPQPSRETRTSPRGRRRNSRVPHRHPTALFAHRR